MAIPGRYATLEVSTDGDTMTPVGGIVDVTYNRDVGEVDITSLSSGGVGEYLQGREDCTIDLSCRLLETDAGQDLLMDAVDGKQFVYYRLKSKSDTARPRIGRAFVSSFSEAGPLDDTAALDATLRCTKLDIPDPALDLRFAETLSLTDQASGSNLISFTRATAATYVGSDGLIKTAASGQARFDHDPTTGESLGLLIEEQRTNLLTYSEQFDNVVWNKDAGISVSPNQIASPSGEQSADKITELASSLPKSIYYILTPSISTTYTFSAYLKSAGVRYIRFTSGGSSLTGPGGSGADRNLVIDLQTFAIANNIPEYSPTVTAVGNGWCRVTITLTTDSDGGGLSPYLLLLNSSQNPNYTGDGVSGIYVWGAQLEAGEFSTSYIPTTTAAATRNADDAIITTPNVDSWFVQNDGTWFADVVFSDQDTSAGVMTASIGSATFNGYALRAHVNDVVLNRRNFSLSLLDATSSGAGIHGKHRFCFYAGSDIGSISADGGTVASSTSIITGIDTGISHIYIGRQVIAGSTANYYLNGTIKRITYYGSRLNNLMLQHITLREAP